ncbi:MAG: D-tyrosyl-tRNA(Tyr) deacylase [Clostridia bacterium]|nr:D-tyrosyl-tRNA(Tyr) deacylase [Clostridia bacterium]
MRAVVQRVAKSEVASGGVISGKIGKGLTVLLGVGENDTKEDALYMAGKISRLRIFEDNEEKMNLSITDVGGDVLTVSQFTLYGDVIKGNRPSFSSAAKPEKAYELYQAFCIALKGLGLHVEEGVFQTDMLLEIHNDGPVTILLDSKKEF